MDKDEKYMIVRYFFKGEPQIIKTDLTLEQAQKHCEDPETSGATCRMDRRGNWFDGYTKQRSST